jgi:hypothetical protein
MSPLTASPGYLPRPWMLFVDGENITIRAQEHAEENNRVIPSTAPVYLKDVYFWPADIFGDPSRVGQGCVF